MSMRASPQVVLSFALGLAAACDGGEEAQCDRVGDLAIDQEPAAHEAGHECDPEVVFGPPSGATCPSDSTLTYEDFAAPFMAEYCNGCHSSTLTGDARQGAPEFHDFDTKNGILAVADHVDWKAASGPDATNELMPVGSGPVPTLVEREQLGEWLACELAAMQ